MHSKAQLATCHPELQELFHEVIKYWDCTVLEGHRGKEAHNDAFERGANKVKWPHGKHNSTPSMAVDVVPYPIDWKDEDRMRIFGGFVLGIAATLDIKIRWGGGIPDKNFDWDLPHFEIVN